MPGSNGLISRALQSTGRSLGQKQQSYAPTGAAGSPGSAAIGSLPGTGGAPGNTPQFRPPGPSIQRPGRSPTGPGAAPVPTSPPGTNANIAPGTGGAVAPSTGGIGAGQDQSVKSPPQDTLQRIRASLRSKSNGQAATTANTGG